MSASDESGPQSTDRRALDVGDLVGIATANWVILIVTAVVASVAAYIFDTGDRPYVASVIVPYSSSATGPALAALVNELVGANPSRSLVIDPADKSLRVLSEADSLGAAKSDVTQVVRALADQSAWTGEELEDLRERHALIQQRSESLSRLLRALEPQLQDAISREMNDGSTLVPDGIAQFMELDTRIAELHEARLHLEDQLALRLVPTANVEVYIAGGPSPLAIAARLAILVGIVSLLLVYLSLVGRTYLRRRKMG